MKKTFQNILSFVVIFLIVNLVINFFFKPGAEPVQNTITLTPVHNDFEVGSTVTVDLKNNTLSEITLKNTCPDEPLKVLEQVNGQWVEKHNKAEISCDGTADVVVKPGDKHTITFNNWNHSLFNEPAQYKVQAVIWVPPTAVGDDTQTQQQPTAGVSMSQQAVQTAPNSNLQSKVVESTQFEIKPQGWLGWFWTTLFYQPIYNTLIFLLSIIPGHSLGLAIILLTLLIRTILLIPNQKALESQRRMQEVQPKLNHIKEKYKDNQEMVGKETLAVMQQHKVNPLGSCLPLLIQFPILIALYYAVQNGLNPDNGYLLYGGLRSFNYNSINVVLLGILDLTKINPFILPIFVGALQFFQMKLAIVRNKKAQGESTEKKKSEMDTANSMMLYFMPAMIAIFTASAPAGVGVYWATSTIYGISQQLVVNRKADQGKSKVTVIEKT